MAWHLMLCGRKIFYNSLNLIKMARKQFSSARASRRQAERKSKKNVQKKLSQFDNREATFVDWQKVIKMAKSNLMSVFGVYTAEIQEYLHARIFLDVLNQPEDGISFNYKELDIQKFLRKSIFDEDFTTNASMNYYNACIIESRKLNYSIALLAISVMSSIEEQFKCLTEAELIKDIANSSGFKTVEVNDAYLKIKPDLIKRRWINEESNFTNSFSIGNEVVVENTPALRLVNDIFNITLKPHLNGIEISRLEVYEKHQGKNYASRFLDNILLFLVKMNIREIYVMPLPSGFRTKKGISGDLKLLESFFYKRGFRSLNGQPYWQLTDMTYLDTIAETEIEYSLFER